MLEPSQEKYKNEVKREQAVDCGPADFETAIAATGYGRFNFLLLLIAMPCCICTVFETTTMSYVLPSAECDLHLTLVDKGTLNAVTYVGMISSAFLWGFLSDMYGRKRLLVYGFFLDATFNVLCATSQTVVAIMIFKFMGGFIICGPFAVLMAYLSEFHSLQHRSRVMILIGIFYSIGNVLLPSLAWIIIPQEWDFLLFGGKFAIHSWQIFLAVCCFPSLLSGACVLFMPESPKFLMSKGRNEQAMAVFQKLYSLNTGRSRGEYPIKELMNETTLPSEADVGGDGTQTTAKGEERTTSCSSKLKGLRDGLQQILGMFRKPHLKNSLLAYSIQFGILFGLNTFRLWVPQLFNIIDEYELDPNPNLNADATLCDMLAYKVNKSNSIHSQEAVSSALDQQQLLLSPESDVVDMNNIILCEATTEGSMYLKSLIIGFVGVFAYVITTMLINAIGNRNILVYGLLTSGVCGVSLYWAKSSAIVLALSSTYITITSISSTALVGSVVAMFPTSMRTMVVSLTMMFGRTGSIIGNLLFPYLMSLGCWPPFVMIGAIQIAVSLIATTIPRTVRKPLQ
ncbi:synaptic vesicle glycoprotein 2C-like [Toxorhynchites rutilus septentrionalis]|uniref:synaptic vesicle glycoprotein 2C-like n=1 Tax=Toxorhynchites rutilus septentrionalis TaxID=329112 RepID=UPI002479A711|nr:synaptic vesicle glycoprotein 2C-like [Toxorhynchites rutilus septentrionalis]